ncbi:MAG: hypothetical protein MUC92_10150 [Fimbriimonadaceae bacterium]|jgi:hypothetical protein|nr:hypothetical protein [Fimbriimonadaceae bacterium]
MVPDCCPQEQVLRELDEIAPHAPFLSLGQTVFWDEPLKAGVVLQATHRGRPRKLVAGVHDTDYFAKLPGFEGGDRFQALPHNDTTTKNLWSAAAEFNSLFGSETIPTKDKLHQAGVRLNFVSGARQGLLDELTEAWGWKGVVSTHSESKITAEKQLGPLFPTLQHTFRWAVQESLERIQGPEKAQSQAISDRLLGLTCDHSEGPPDFTLSQYYQKLLPELYNLLTQGEVEPEVTATSQLLRFNRETVSLPRFDLVRLFVDSVTRTEAAAAYDELVKGTDVYTLSRFGTGAIPFDLYIPGVGRGTLRLGTRGGVVMTPKPVGFSFKSCETLEELAEIIEKRFGTECVLIGKAITLIGMLAREHVFIFHEGASSYVKTSRLLHQRLNFTGLNPILRVTYHPWDALKDVPGWLSLPEPWQKPFGTSEMSTGSFATRWKEVVRDQRQLLEDLSKLQRPLDLVRYLQGAAGGHWNCLANEYDGRAEVLTKLRATIAEFKAKKKAISLQMKELKRDRAAVEKEKGDHWRAKIFQLQPTEQDYAQRDAYEERLAQIADELETLGDEWLAWQVRQDEAVTDPEVQKANQRRREISLEAEMTRLRLAREAILASEGLEKSGHRPAAWWFPLVSPDGTWFRKTIEQADYRLESLT